MNSCVYYYYHQSNILTLLFIIFPFSKCHSISITKMLFEWSDTLIFDNITSCLLDACASETIILLIFRHFRHSLHWVSVHQVTWGKSIRFEKCLPLLDWGLLSWSTRPNIRLFIVRLRWWIYGNRYLSGQLVINFILSVLRHSLGVLIVFVLVSVFTYLGIQVALLKFSKYFITLVDFRGDIFYWRFSWLLIGWLLLCVDLNFLYRLFNWWCWLAFVKLLLFLIEKSLPVFENGLPCWANGL